MKEEKEIVIIQIINKELENLRKTIISQLKDPKWQERKDNSL